MTDETTDSVGILNFSRTIRVALQDIAYARINPSQILVRCVRCKDIHALPITARQIARIETDDNAATVIRRICPNLTPSLGEMLISGLCGVCWDEIHDVNHKYDETEDDLDEEMGEDPDLKVEQLNLEISWAESSLSELAGSYQSSYDRLTENERVIRSIQIERLDTRRKELIREREDLEEYG